MTYDKQRSLQLLRLGSGKSDACFREGQEGAIMQPWASGWMQHKPDDLNYTNRPVRIRMPGGVGGARSVILTAPIPMSVSVPSSCDTMRFESQMERTS